MKFKMNNKTWEIKEVSQKELKEYNNDTDVGYYFGQTHFNTQEVWIDESLSKEQKKLTLLHELMHVYINSFITTTDLTFNEELLCDISSNSHYIIHDIVENYNKTTKKD